MSGNSTVAAMLAEINAQYAAAYAAMHGGLSAGTARHDFINAKMDRTQEIGEQLIETVGREQALPLIVKALESATSSVGDNDKQ